MNSVTDAITGRSVEQIAHENAMLEVAETLMNIEQAKRRAERAVQAVALLGRDRNTELALRESVKALESIHRSLFQEAYSARAQQKLL